MAGRYVPCAPRGPFIHLRMPRFGDIFVYETCARVSGNEMTFTRCRLIKNIDGFKAHDAVQQILFDLSGMYLLFKNDEKVCGPYLLTTN